MELFEAIKNRRSVGKVKPDPVPTEWIEKLLEAATWAPNHHHTEPWKFVVLTGEGRRPLGRVLAEIALEEARPLSYEEKTEIIKKQMAKPFRAPAIITVIATPSDHPKAVWREELAAGHAAIQNMLLAAHALGLGAVWRTGKPAYHPKMKELFQLRDQDEVLGFIYVGYPDIRQVPAKRIPYQKKTIWIKEDVAYPLEQMEKKSLSLTS